MKTLPPSYERIDNTRRRFFRRFLAEALVLFDEINGRPQMRLGQIGQLGDPLIRQMAPVLNMERSPRIRDNILFSIDVGDGSDRPVCLMNQIQAYIFCCFDGKQNIGDIGNQVACRFGLNTGHAYDEVKSLFIFLAKRAICYPAAAHDEGP